MLDICHYINLNIEELRDNQNIHAHLIIDSTLNLIPFKIYFPKSLEEKKDQLINWIKSQKDYSEFGKRINTVKINSPNYVLNIDYSKSKIGLIADTNIGEDRDGKFLGFGFKQITVSYRNNQNFDSQEIYSEIILDNHSYNLIDSLINVDTFNSHPKIWQSTNSKTNPIRFGKCNLILDFLESLEKDEDNYPLLIKRKPRVILQHKELDLEVLLNYCTLITAVLSFYQGSIIDFKEAILNFRGTQIVQYRPKKNKEKILRKNLGRFSIEDGVYEFLEKINTEKLGEVDFISQIIKLFDKGLLSDGTTEFMLYFTVIEKLRNHVQKSKPNKEKFNFTNGKAINKIIREKLDEIKEYLKEDEKPIFEAAKNDKLVNIKYLPQKDQFTKFFTMLENKSEDYGLDWKKIVGLRGAIFHGKYIESEDPELIELNSKVRLFTGNLIYNYLTKKLEDDS